MPSKVPVLTPDGPMPAFAAVSRDRNVLRLIEQNSQLRVVCWVPDWSNDALAFLANPSSKDMLMPPRAPNWLPDEGTTESAIRGYNHHHRTHDFSSGHDAKVQYVHDLGELMAPQAGRSEVIRTVASVFSAFARIHTNSQLTTASTAYISYTTMGDAHPDSGKLLVNFSTNPGTYIIDTAHPSLKGREVNGLLQDEVAVASHALPGNSFSIWRGDDIPEQALWHISPAYDGPPKARRFLQGYKPL